jgi:deoxyribonuclease V
VSLERRLDDLRRIQRDIATKVILEDKFVSPLKTVAGVDLAFLGKQGVVAGVVMDYPPTKVIESKTLVMPLTFPYIPTFLFFREGPLIIKVMSSLESKVSVFLINGQGIAHPLRCGIASHLGVDSSKPTIGVTSNCLVGEYDHEPEDEGEAVPLIYQVGTVGWVLKSCSVSKPIFISPGHQVGLDSSLQIVKACLAGYRLPVPIQMAHLTANSEKRRLEVT